MDPDVEVIYMGSRTDCAKPTDPRPSSHQHNPQRSQWERGLKPVDPDWEVIDPSPNIHTLFSTFNKEYFSSKLDFVTLAWSSVMTNYPGLCKYSPLGGCTILLSEPLLQYRPRADLVHVLLHEMIHSYLFLTLGNKHGHDDHGPEFQRHLRRINSVAGTQITIHHSHKDLNLSKENAMPSPTSCSTSNIVKSGNPSNKSIESVLQPKGFVGTGPKVSGKPCSLVDPIWETLDPTPNISDLFIIFNTTYFWGKLGPVTVSWSPRMTTCAGICRYSGGACSITLSTPLLTLRPRRDLVETLLHEMIHAYLFLTPGCHHQRDRDGHGNDFQEHMLRINKETGTNITIYHSFHNEVDYYKVHWWKCDGPCQHRPPYYGIVKRAMNRAPGPNDFWWKEHQRSCGGTYVKIKEPQKKKNSSKPKDTGNVLGGGSIPNGPTPTFFLTK